MKTSIAIFAAFVATSSAVAQATTFDTVALTCTSQMPSVVFPNNVEVALAWAGTAGSASPTAFYSEIFDAAAVPRKRVLSPEDYHFLEDAIGFMIDGIEGGVTVSVSGLACPEVTESALFTGDAVDLSGAEVHRMSVEVTSIEITTPGTNPAGSDVAVGLTLRFGDDAPLTRTTALGATELCPRGGRKLESGKDLAPMNDVLDDAEVTDTAYVCDPLDAFDARILVTAEPPGDHCSNGGFKLDSGLDDDRNGTLDEDEIDDTEYACSGATGPAGEPGGDGEKGEPGEAGTDGAAGSDGADGASAPETSKGGCHSTNAAPWLLALVLLYARRLSRRAL